MTDWVVRIPASSANLGAGFDVLGMALGLHAEAGVGDPPRRARRRSTTAIRPTSPSAGWAEIGPLWMRSPIPIGRGLGFSGAARVGGAAAAVVQRSGPTALDDAGDAGGDPRGHERARAARRQRRRLDLRRRRGGRRRRRRSSVPLAFNPMVVVWVPELDDHLDRALARAAARHGVAGRRRVQHRAGGDVRRRLRQRETSPPCGPPPRIACTSMHRLAQVPESAVALDAALDAGAWAAWLSGSGPTIAALCDPGAGGRDRRRAAGQWARQAAADRSRRRGRARGAATRDRPTDARTAVAIVSRSSTAQGTTTRRCTRRRRAGAAC